MITALALVPRGKAKETPVRDEPSPTELEQLRAAALQEGALEKKDESGDDGDLDEDQSMEGSSGGEDEDVAIERARAVAESMANQAVDAEAGQKDNIEGAFEKLDMENYDNDEDNLVSRLLQGSKVDHVGDDPYITLEEEADDTQDDCIKATDLLVLAAKTEEDSAALEVWLFDAANTDGDINAYVHHDIMLPAFPLSVAWLDYSTSEPSTSGNFVAVSTLEPEIEIWDLDVIDSLQPVCVLGGHNGDDGSEPERKSKKRRNKEGFKPGSHTDSVLALAWNTAFRNVLASGSADKTIKAWDLATGACQHTLTPHTDKVQALAWNPAEASCLLSGGFDKRACLSDVRTPVVAAAAWQCSADVESLAWSPHAPTLFAVSAESGEVTCYDTRNGAGSAAVFTLAAHDKPTTSIAFNPVVPHMLVTASIDKTVKLWDVSDNAPKLVASQDLGVGAVFTVGVPSDAAHLIAAGGAKGEVALWDLRAHDKLRRTYKKHFRAH